MVSVPVVIPLAGRINTNHAGHCLLVDFGQRCAHLTQCRVLVDVTELYWLDANMCTLFYAILYHLNLTQGIQFLFDREQLTARLTILARNGFLGDALRMQLPDRAGTTVEFRYFACQQDQQFTTYVDEHLLAHPTLQLSPARRATMLNDFLELFSNVVTHAHLNPATAPPMFACGQYYPTRNCLHFSLADLGRGFLPGIQARQPAVTNAEAAILWAVAEGNTIRDSNSGGFGLSNLLEHCQQTGGELQIHTGNAFWSSRRPQRALLAESFAGTVVNLLLPCA